VCRGDFLDVGALNLVQPEQDFGGDAGHQPAIVTATAGDAWKSWGWYVVERDGFYKPNRFGYGPDGYRLQIMAAPQPGYPPSLQGISLCFPANLPDDRGPFPMVLTAD
jgi:hypothetical protein